MNPYFFNQQLNNNDMLSKEKILSYLKSYSLDFIPQILYFPETDSTNIQAKKAAKEGCPDFTMLVADAQTLGKGRLGRSFASPCGVGIFMTLLLRPVLSPLKASMITLVAGLAVRKALKLHCDLDTHIKWPNDIVINGKKVCGILTEMSANMQQIDYIAVGIGVNVNNNTFPKDLSSVATSIFLESGKKMERSDLIAIIIKYFQEYYKIFLETGDLSLLKDEYNEHMINKNAPVFVLNGDDKFYAVAKYIDCDGELIVEKDGQLIKVLSGEVSVRGVYGYV